MGFVFLSCIVARVSSRNPFPWCTEVRAHVCFHRQRNWWVMDTLAETGVLLCSSGWQRAQQILTQLPQCWDYRWTREPQNYRRYGRVRFTAPELPLPTHYPIAVVLEPRGYSRSIGRANNWPFCLGFLTRFQGIRM